MNIQKLDQQKLAKTGDEYKQLLSGNADWVARTAADVHSLRAAKAGPFGKLSQGAFDAFAASLQFKGGGLGHASYKPLMAELSLTEIFEVFGYFGLSPIQVLDIQDKKCASPHTCSSSLFDVCTSTC
jgi:hypothetical protein